MKYPIEKMRACLALLPPPGGEVVAECLDEIESLRQQLEYRTHLLRQARLLLKHGKGKDDILTVECVGRIDEALK